jgi:acetate kinase
MNIINLMKTLNTENPIPIETSARHCHLSAEHREILFGKDHPLTVLKDLSQPGQFACREKVNLKGPTGSIPDVRVLGPERGETQVEISRTDQFKLGLDAPVRLSGEIEGTPGITLEGPAGSVTLSKGVIMAARHIHMTQEDADTFGVENNYVVRVKLEGNRELIYGDVIIRVSPKFALAMHLDTDEANAANLGREAFGRLESVQNTTGEI